MLHGVSCGLKQSVDKSQSSKEVMEYRITLEENTHGSKSKKSKLKNIIERCMDVFAEPDHKVGETDHLEVNMDLVEDANLKNKKNKNIMDSSFIRGNQLDDEEDLPVADG